VNFGSYRLLRGYGKTATALALIAANPLPRDDADQVADNKGKKQEGKTASNSKSAAGGKKAGDKGRKERRKALAGLPADATTWTNATFGWPRSGH
jgi:hypothetical protein